MKQFPLCLELLEVGRMLELKHTAILFVVFLIAHYHEKARRVLGGYIDSNITTEGLSYKVEVTDKAIKKSLGICSDTIISIKRELHRANREVLRIVRKNGAPGNDPVGFIKMKLIRVASDTREYQKYKHKKYRNLEFQYELCFSPNQDHLFRVPTKVLYDRAITPSQKLAVIWNVCSRGFLSRKVTLTELEEMSGISERTIRTAKRYYPELFDRKYLPKPWGS